MAYEKELSRIDRDFLNETGRETLGNDVWIFDDFDSEHLRHLPMRLDMPLFALCLGGEAVISLNVAEYKIQPDTLIALMPDVILRNIEPSEDARGIFLCLSQSFAEEIMPNIHALLPVSFGARMSPVVKISEADAQCLCDFHALLWKIIRTERGRSKRQMVQNVIRAMLYKLIDIYDEQNGKVVKRSRNEEIFYSFAQLVERDYRIDRTVQHYADILCITAKHLSKIVKQKTGKRALEVINSHAIHQIKLDLLLTDIPISQLADKYHFGNFSFSCRFVKVHLGMTPQAYRAQRKREDQ